MDNPHESLNLDLGLSESVNDAGSDDKPGAGGVTVEDVTNNDGGYDGDIEEQLPYELEEPDSDSELDANSTHALNATTLAQDFRALRCHTPEIEGPSATNPSRSRKRSSSQLMSDKEDDPSLPRSATPTPKRQRKAMFRKHLGINRSRMASEEPMDVDMDRDPAPPAT